MTAATITTITTSTTPAVREGRVRLAREAIADAFRKPRFAQRAAYRAELFRLARHSVPDLTDAELDAGLRAMVAAGNLQARKVNGKTMYHYTSFWERAAEEARRALPPAFKPNSKGDGLWLGPDRHTLAMVARPLLSCQNEAQVVVTLFVDGQKVDGEGVDVRSAYREACRQQRLARHDIADLLRQVDGLQRSLDTAMRKIASDGALQLRLYAQIDELKNALGHELQDALVSLNRGIAEELSQLRARVAELERENEELRRETAGESLGDDLAAIVAALTTERDNLRAENSQLRYDMGCMKAEIEELGSELDALRAFQSRQESEQPPF